MPGIDDGRPIDEVNFAFVLVFTFVLAFVLILLFIFIFTLVFILVLIFIANGGGRQDCPGFEKSFSRDDQESFLAGFYLKACERQVGAHRIRRVQYGH